MENVPVLKGASVILRDIIKSDRDDRYALGKPDEFVYMCGGNRNESCTG